MKKKKCPDCGGKQLGSGCFEHDGLCIELFRELRGVGVKSVKIKL